MELITLIDKLAEALAGASILAASVIALYIVVTASTTFGIVYIITKSIYKMVSEWIDWLKTQARKPKTVTMKEFPSNMVFPTKTHMEKALSLISKVQQNGVGSDGIYEGLGKILDLAADEESGSIYSFKVEKLYEELKRNR